MGFLIGGPFLFEELGAHLIMSKRLDIEGQQFGKLTAIRTAGKNACEQMLWECVCECGRTTISTAVNLKLGKTRSCGCLQHMARDLSGQTFGKLTAIRRVKNPPEKKRVKRSATWLCACTCGREKVIDANSLATGNSKSCGDCSWGRYEFVDGHVIGHFENNTTFLIDSSDYEQVSKYRWWLDKRTGYFCSNVNQSMVYLHRLLMPDREGFVCDHINRIKSDYRRANLRYATPRQNSQNRSKGCNNTSGYIGVCWHIRQKKFVAGIKVANRTINLGAFDSAEEAARVRDEAALLHFGRFANLNFGGNDEREDAYACKDVHAAHVAV